MLTSQRTERNVIALDNFFPAGTTKADFPALLKWHNSLCEIPYVKVRFHFVARSND